MPNKAFCNLHLPSSRLGTLFGLRLPPRAGMSRRPAPSTPRAYNLSPLKASPVRPREPANSVPTPTSSTPEKHPFANTTSKLEIVRPSTSGDIDVEEEVQLYDDLCRDNEAETDEVSVVVSAFAAQAVGLDGG